MEECRVGGGGDLAEGARDGLGDCGAGVDARAVWGVELGRQGYGVGAGAHILHDVHE